MPYKQAPKSMALKALIGNQKNLPEALKAKILAAPEAPAKKKEGSIVSPSGHVGKAPSCGCGKKTCNCGNVNSPNKQADLLKPNKKAGRLYDRSEKIYNKSEQLFDRADNAANAGKAKKSARLTNKAIRKEEKAIKVLGKAFKANRSTKKS